MFICRDCACRVYVYVYIYIYRDCTCRVYVYMYIYLDCHERVGRNAPGAHCASHIVNRYEGNSVKS